MQLKVGRSVCVRTRLITKLALSGHRARLQLTVFKFAQEKDITLAERFDFLQTRPIFTFRDLFLSNVCVHLFFLWRQTAQFLRDLPVLALLLQREALHMTAWSLTVTLRSILTESAENTGLWPNTKMAVSYAVCSVDVFLCMYKCPKKLKSSDG